MNKKRAGVTLVELIIAISILTAVTAPIMAVMVSSFQVSAQAQEMKNASFAAQQAMEELIGRSWNGPLNATFEGGAGVDRWHPYLAHFAWEQPHPINVGGRRYYFFATYTGDRTTWPSHSVPGWGTVPPSPLLQVTVCIHATHAAASAPLVGGRPPNPMVSHTTWINTVPGGFVNP